jgi:hypothetical protein
MRMQLSRLWKEVLGSEDVGDFRTFMKEAADLTYTEARRKLLKTYGTPELASLWPVHSNATAKLMREFHSRLRKDPKGDKASALREAMLAIKEEYPFVVLWAPFCLYGRHN